MKEQVGDHLESARGGLRTRDTSRNPLTKGENRVSNSRNWFKIAGLVLHVLIAALMIFASLGKLTGTTPAEVLESLRKAGLDGSYV